MWDYKIINGVPFIKCPICGASLKIGIPICPKCNRPIKWDEENAIEVYYTNCPKCGADIEAFTETCPQCGAQLVWDKEQHIKLKEKLAKEKKAGAQSAATQEAITRGGSGDTKQAQEMAAEPMKFKCPNCGTIVTGKPSKCPGCGAPFIWD